MTKNKGRPLSEAHKKALKCAPGCTCRKHTLRNSGQFRAGQRSGFSGQRHSEETKAKLATYKGPAASSYKHGLSDTPTYLSWRGAIGRCYESGNASYRYYGAKGVTVCDRWRGSNGFENFIADMGMRPESKTLDRIDPWGNYEPTNCRWATAEEQYANKRRDN